MVARFTEEHQALQRATSRVADPAGVDPGPDEIYQDPGGIDQDPGGFNPDPDLTFENKTGYRSVCQ